MTANANAYTQMRTQVLTAITGKDVELMEQLIKNGLDVNTIIPETGETFLHMAVKEGCPEIAKVLLENGANPSQGDIDGITPLHLAVEQDDVSMAKLLLAKGANPNAVITENGLTPLHLAAGSANEPVSMVRVLLAAGANPNQVDLSGETPLQTVCKITGNKDIIHALLEYGAKDPSGKKPSDYTPMKSFVMDENGNYKKLSRDSEETDLYKRTHASQESLEKWIGEKVKKDHEKEKSAEKSDGTEEKRNPFKKILEAKVPSEVAEDIKQTESKDLLNILMKHSESEKSYSNETQVTLMDGLMSSKDR